tara:strand:- start:9 stop:956 length:948 start_codon:yes stop_codon:yes gene_type:complete
MNNTLSQRDAFFNTLYEKIKEGDRDIIILMADMGAPALDDIRREFPNQIYNTGISEQNTITAGSGLAMEGKKVFAYAIATFMVLRAIELIRIENSVMNIPMTIVACGAGFSYEDAGPTHFQLEDIACMRVYPNIDTHMLTDSVMSAHVAGLCVDDNVCFNNSRHIRMERQVTENVYDDKTDFSKGFNVIKKGKNYIVSTGIMVHEALKMSEKLDDVGVIDVHTLVNGKPGNVEEFLKAVGKNKKLAVVEEHYLPGGLGSSILETLCDSGVYRPTLRLGYPTEPGYPYVYGGRDLLRSHFGRGFDASVNDIKTFLG